MAPSSLIFEPYRRGAGCRRSTLQMLCCTAGDVLNCNIYDVATHAAVELQADKLIIMRCPFADPWLLTAVPLLLALTLVSELTSASAFPQLVFLQCQTRFWTGNA